MDSTTPSATGRYRPLPAATGSCRHPDRRAAQPTGTVTPLMIIGWSEVFFTSSERSDW
jgi:hypothetical protein